MNTVDVRAELEQLQQELQARQSTQHFAHAGVALPATLIFASAAAKLFRDWKLHAPEKLPLLGALASLVALGLLAYSVVHLVRGRATLRRERARFARLKELRASMGLDDPARLLPRV